MTYWSNDFHLTLKIFRTSIIRLSALTKFRFTSITTIWATRIAWTRSLTTIVILVTFKSTSRVQSTQLVTVVKSQHTMLGAIISQRFIPKSIIHVSYTLITYRQPGKSCPTVLVIKNVKIKFIISLCSS